MKNDNEGWKKKKKKTNQRTFSQIFKKQKARYNKKNQEWSARFMVRNYKPNSRKSEWESLTIAK